MSEDVLNPSFFCEYLESLVYGVRAQTAHPIHKGNHDDSFPLILQDKLNYGNRQFVCGSTDANYGVVDAFVPCNTGFT